LERHLSLPGGYYGALHILTLLGFMALARIRRPEGLRHAPPGELGKAVGLDRVPEVRTLREKVAQLAEAGQPREWMRELSRRWMEADPEEAGYLYVDGHVRVYHGADARLPRRYVSRERLCLRGTTDYWVNDAIGRPFFVVSQAVTDGLAAALVNEIALLREWVDLDTSSPHRLPFRRRTRRRMRLSGCVPVPSEKRFRMSQHRDDGGRAKMKRFDMAPFALPNGPAGEVKFEEPRDVDMMAARVVAGDAAITDIPVFTPSQPARSALRVELPTVDGKSCVSVENL